MTLSLKIFLFFLAGASFLQAHWLDDTNYPAWAQRGRIVYIDGVGRNQKIEADLTLLEDYRKKGAIPFIHAFTPHWPDDPELVERIEKAGF
ncbi:MAG: hypothetical protein NC823_01975, partial [Candidatus Omnitrophica bacterium]|nr:hypothetical protein [Candidatus Omnitrophota bacterium]